MTKHIDTIFRVGSTQTFTNDGMHCGNHAYENLSYLHRFNTFKAYLIYSFIFFHYREVIMIAMASQITSLTIVVSTVSGRDQGKHKSSTSLALVRGIPGWPMNFPHKGPVTR